MTRDIVFYSGRVVGNRRAKALGRVQNGPVDEKSAPGDARTRHDAVQALSGVHAPRGHRDEVYGTRHVSAKTRTR